MLFKFSKTHISLDIACKVLKKQGAYNALNQALTKSVLHPIQHLFSYTNHIE